MAQIDPEDADYVCSLSEASIEKAKKELNEDPKERLLAVKALRDWIKQQPHMDVDTDTIQMLKFLRCAKFSQLNARTLVDNTFTIFEELRQRISDPEIDIFDPDVKQFIEKGELIPLGRDKNGCMVILQRVAAQDPDLLKHVPMRGKLMNSHHAMWSHLMMSEESQVNGYVFITDTTGITMKHNSHMDLADLKIMSKFWKKAMTLRFKAIHVYNAGPIWETMMEVFKPFMPKKFAERTHMHPTMETIYKAVPMELLPDEYLPDDYKGPRAGTTQQLIDKFVGEVCTQKFRDVLLKATDRNRHFVDEAKRLKDDPSLNASFRKLNVD